MCFSLQQRISMNKLKFKTVFTSKDYQSIPISNGKRQYISQNSKLFKRQNRCVSEKIGSRLASAEVSKVSSKKNGKRKTKRKPILLISQHQTPVLGKFFTANHSNTNLSKDEQLQSQPQRPQPPQQSPSKVKYSQITRMVPERSYQKITQNEQQSTIKTPLSIHEGNLPHPLKLMPPSQVQRKLDTTINKLRSKQQTIQLLNKTIHTRLVDAAQGINQPKNYKSREDAYQIQMNFYIDKITQLQKELHQLKHVEYKHEEFTTAVRNNKKLIKENSRLRESLQLSNREVAALKKIINKERIL